MLTAAASPMRLAEARTLVSSGAARVLTPPAPTMRRTVSCSSSPLGAAPLLAFALLAHGAQQLAAGVAKPQRGLKIGVTINLSQHSWFWQGVHTRSSSLGILPPTISFPYSARALCAPPNLATCHSSNLVFGAASTSIACESCMSHKYDDFAHDSNNTRLASLTCAPS